MNRWLYVAAITVLIGVGCARIVATYDEFWQTWDEPAHIACGLQWWEKGEYSYERFHPPLARMFVAAGPYFAGVRGTPVADNYWIEGNTLLHDSGRYERNLSLARLGVLPFFVLASLVVAAWTLRCGGELASSCAVFLFASIPPILGHAGIATLDMASAALVCAALFALALWIEKPNAARAIAFGLLAGFATTSKFSAAVFVVVGGLVIFLICGITSKLNSRPLGLCFPRQPKLHLLFACAATALTIWGVYRFSLQPAIRGSGATLDLLGEPLASLAPALRNFGVNVPLPAVDFWRGIFELFNTRRGQGSLGYCLGEIGNKGWWYFYLVATLVKTPLAFLGLFFVGVVSALPLLRTSKALWCAATPAFAAASILAAGIFVTPHNGLRQILAIYPLMAIVAALGAARLWRAVTFPWLGKSSAMSLVLLCAATAYSAHPDYIAYCNVLGGRDPASIVGDGDVDLGQDLKRLSEACSRLSIDRLCVAYNGTYGIDLSRFHLPPVEILKPYSRTTGWVAISRRMVLLGSGQEPYDQFAWLRSERLVEQVGSSILLYYIAP